MSSSRTHIVTIPFYWFMMSLTAFDVSSFDYWVYFINSGLLLCSGANLVFDVYDFVGTGTIDAVNLADALRALNLNPTLVTIEKLGGTKKKGKQGICSCYLSDTQF